MTLPLVRLRRMDLESFAHDAGIHPDLVRRLVALGLLEPVIGSGGRHWFSPDQLAAAARIQRLRAGFALNYAAIGLVVDLLDRIAELDEVARRAKPNRSQRIGG